MKGVFVISKRANQKDITPTVTVDNPHNEHTISLALHVWFNCHLDRNVS